MTALFTDLVLKSPRRLALPIGVLSGAAPTGATVRDLITSPAAQAEAAAALHQRFATPALLTVMDLSVEAEAFGCTVRMLENEIPTVVGRRVTSLAEARTLPVPDLEDGRAGVHLETGYRLLSQARGAPVLGGMIGPFSLVGRLMGVSEALEASAASADLVEVLLEKAARFLIDYALAWKEQGVQGVVLAEPAAGLLSPRALSRFSAAYVRRIIAAVQDEQFEVIYHNCGARLAHLPAVLEGGAGGYHFGASMDLPAALQTVPAGLVLGGNLDPSAVFLAGTPEQVEQRTRALLDALRPFRNAFASSGCDLPAGVPLANLEAFFRACAP